jgi:hypothetical protein
MEKHLDMIKPWPHWLRGRKRAEESQWWTHLKNMGGRDHTASGNMACPVWKKGVLLWCVIIIEQSYCCLQHKMYEILTNILYVKLVPYAEEVIERTNEAFQKEDRLLIRFLLWDKCWKYVGNRI